LDDRVKKKADRYCKWCNVIVRFFTFSCFQFLSKIYDFFKILISFFYVEVDNC
jgi:hypothetical protein